MDRAKLTKKGLSAGSMVSLIIGFVLLIIAVVIVFNIFGDTASDVTTAMATACDSGLPLATVLYDSQSGAAAYMWVLVPFIIVVGMIIVAVKTYKK